MVVAVLVALLPLAFLIVAASALPQFRVVFVIVLVLVLVGLTVAPGAGAAPEGTPRPGSIWGWLVERHWLWGLRDAWRWGSLTRSGWLPGRRRRR